MIRKPAPFFFKHGKTAVILIHSYASNPNDMRMLARSLEKDDYTVYAPMFTGHGTNDPRDIINNGSPQSWWQDTKRAIQYLRDQGHSQIAIFGLSLGGMFATKALEEYSDLIAGGTFSTPIIDTGNSNVPINFIKMAETIYDSQGLSQEQQKAPLNWLSAHVGEQLKTIYNFDHEVAAQLNRVEVPVFIGQGAEDKMIDAVSGKLFNQKMLALHKNVTFKWYEGAGHVITVNGAHKQLETDVRDFLNNITR